MKCTPSHVEGRCRACVKQDKACTFTYVHKKPGRPLGSTKKRHDGSAATSPSSPAVPSAAAAATTTPVAAATNGVPGFPSVTSAAAIGGSAPTPIGPTPGSLFGSARLTCEDPSVPLGDLGIPNLLPPPLPTFDSFTGGPLPSPNSSSSDPQQSTSPSAISSLTAILPWEDASFFLNLYLTHQHCLVPLIHKPSFAQAILARRDKTSPVFRALLCAVVAWTIAQCPISLMPGYSRSDLGRWVDRCLAHNDALRRERDSGAGPGRATTSGLNGSNLGFGVSPAGTAGPNNAGLAGGATQGSGSENDDVELLELLTASMLDWVTAQSLARPIDLLVSQITRYIDALHLRSARSWPCPITSQLARRVFWIVYTKDKTDAMSGRALILNDFEGLPPLPDEVDDEYITPAGALEQPKGKLSHMTGFLAVVRVFQVLSQCITRHRAWANPLPGEGLGAGTNASASAAGGTKSGTGPRGGGQGAETGVGASTSAGTEDTHGRRGAIDLAAGNDEAALEAAERQAAAEAQLAWIARAQARLRSILSSLPPELSVNLRDAPPPTTTWSTSPSSSSPSSSSPLHLSSSERIKYAIRQCDIVITGLCAEFCLLDFRAAIVPALDTRQEREDLARKSYEVLESMPVEYLASNGECMRGKVLRIILTLLSMTTEPELFSQNIWDWWNMYSRVQFLQVIPDESVMMMGSGL